MQAIHTTRLMRARVANLIMLCAMVFLAGLVAPAAHAQTWPSKGVRLVLPYPPGGISDVLARMLTDKLSQRLGQSFVVDNKPGGSGLIGMDAVTKAAPDGYTITIGANDLSWIDLIVKTGFNLRRDLAPITIMRRGTLVAWVNTPLPAQTVSEFTAYAKANPGKLNYGSNGNGSGNHLAVEYWKLLVGGMDVVHIPYKGESQSAVALAAGEINLVFGTYASYSAQAAAGKVRALAVAGERRLPALPQTPTFIESGLQYTNTYWSGFFAPAGTPRDITAKLASELKAIYQLPDVNPTMVRNGEEVGGQTPEEFAKIIVDEIETRSKAVKAAALKPE